MGATNSSEKKQLGGNVDTAKEKQKDARKRDHTYKAAMLLKYWKTTEEPIRDLCMIIAMYMQDIGSGLLYAAGFRAAFTMSNDGFKAINTLSPIILQDKDGEEPLVKSMMNGSGELHAFLLESGTVRVIKRDQSTFYIALESGIIKMNSGNYCDSLFLVDSQMRAYQIKDKSPIRVTGLPDEIKIKDISCGYQFTVFLSECGRVFGIGLNYNGRLGLPRRTGFARIPIEITFPNQSDSDKNRIIITMIHASQYGWVAVDSKQRAWIIGDYLLLSVHTDRSLLDSCISIAKVWHANNIRITQIECGSEHVIALDTKGRVYWFGRFQYNMPPSRISSDPIPFSHRITEIRSGFISIACKDETNVWYVWGRNTFNHITGLCGCEAVCKETWSSDVISNPMQCEWQSLFDSTRVINLQLGKYKAHVIVDSV